MQSLLILLGVIALVPFTIFYISFSWGFVATVLSSWFIIPLFPQFPVFSWIEYAGMIIFVACFVHNTKTNIKEKYKDNKSDIITSLLHPWFTLFVGWIIHLIY